MKSTEAMILFEKINYYDFLFVDIKKIKEALNIEHINLPWDHTNHVAYFLNTISVGMIPDSKYSTIPEELRQDVIDFFKVLIELECEYKENSIGDFIKKFLKI
jgi:hypothetical protein